MAEIGKFNTLTSSRYTDHGLYLKDEHGNEILLPNKYVPENFPLGKELKVFVYLDSEDRIIATTKQPRAEAGNFAALEIKDVNNVGAFLDWGLEKDLFIPFKEQRKPLKAGETVVVYIFVDTETDRLVATTKLNKFLSSTVYGISNGDEVSVLIANRTDMGYICVVENKFSGLLFANEVFQNLKIGDTLKAYVKNRRQDGKLDLALQKSGYGKVSGLPEQILKKLKMQAGFMPVNSKTDPEVIYKLFGVSKKTFKMAIGSLYKDRKIVITDDGIRLNND